MSLSLPSFDEASGWGAPIQAEDDVVTAAIKKEKVIKYVVLVWLHIETDPHHFKGNCHAAGGFTR